LKRALELARKAVVFDPSLPFGRWSLSRVFSNLRSNDKAMAEMKRATELNPNYAAAFAFMTYIYVRTGRAEEGIRSIEKAMSLNPRFPFWYLHARATAQFSLEQFEAAATNLETALERNPNATWVRSLLIAAYAHIGRQEDAEWQIEEIRAQGFEMSIDDIVETSPLYFPVYKKLYAEGLRKAGLK
jgi:tetratricopeptide (TPR) repeat protein